MGQIVAGLDIATFFWYSRRNTGGKAEFPPCLFVFRGFRSLIGAYLMKRRSSWVVLLATYIPLLFLGACKDAGSPSEEEAGGNFTSDARVFAFLTQSDPFGQYSRFPHADSVVAGTLNGSTAHRPMVSVSLNSHAVSSLVDGRFPTGGSFKDSSVVFKRIIDNGVVTLYAMALKENDNTRSGGGWLWAEYKPDGTVVYSIQNSGAGCVGCHSLEEGPQHDLIRTFERQTQ